MTQHSPIQTEYKGDQFLQPKEVQTGMQDIRASEKDARAAQEELARQSRLNEDRLAEDIIEECQTQLMLKFRFLDRALWRMRLVPQRKGLTYPIATDGKNLYYDPQRIIARFRQSFDEVARDYLHMVLHCIFRQIYDKDHKVADAWSITCDMVVESVAMDLCGERFSSEDDLARRSALDEVALAAGSLLPNKMYEFIKNLVLVGEGQQYGGYSKGSLNEWRRLFERDDHITWPANAQLDIPPDQGEDGAREEMSEDDDMPDFQADGIDSETLGENNPEESQNADESDASEDADSENEQADSESDETTQQHFDLDELEKEEQDDPDESQKDWEEIAKEIEMNLETFSKEWGEEAGNLIANLTIANRRTYDYSDFLRKFMTVTEQIRLNPEEFDYTYYMFGMNMYGNMPFIEPLEYKETESIRDFVIVIDTSESVSGPLVRKFIEHTFSILKESESVNTNVNIHVIQADSKVQSDLKIKDLRQVDKLLEGFQIRGFGGTDFRPAFDYVEMLRKRGELSDLKGMIYFTDGIGQFPEKVADFDTAFVFVDDGSRELPPVPPWAMKLVIDERDIERLK